MSRVNLTLCLLLFLKPVSGFKDITLLEFVLELQKGEENKAAVHAMDPQKYLLIHATFIVPLVEELRVDVGRTLGMSSSRKLRYITRPASENGPSTVSGVLCIGRHAHMAGTADVQRRNAGRSCGACQGV